MENDIARSIQKLADITAKYVCEADDSDYLKFEENKRFLLRIAEVENSSLTVMDLCKKNYMLLCSKFNEMIGYSQPGDKSVNPEHMFSYMHPDDIAFVLDSSLKSLEFLNTLDPLEKKDYKLISDFRLKNKKGVYVRFIQQMVVLELDKNGQIWLLLKLVDLMSEKAGDEPAQRKLINMKTGKLCLFNDDDLDYTSDKLLTNREMEILGLISQGLVSKQISERLFISVNTVNNHRQNILSKTKSENTTQALLYAKKIGVI